MNLFMYLTVGVTLVLGLGVTMLLTSLLTAFRARREVRMDWIPFAWAGYILLIQSQYFWATWGLHSQTEWNVVTFGAPLLVAGVIFVAAGLVLPSPDGEYPDDLRTYFEEDGRWAIAALMVRGVVAIGANVLVLEHRPELLVLYGMIFAQIAAAFFFLRSKRRRLQVIATILYGLMLALTVVATTSFSYPAE